MAIDHSASTAYAGIRFAPRPGTSGRTCAQGSPAQVKYISDLARDLHAVRVQQVNTAAALPGAWDAATVQTLLSSLGTPEDAVARQMAQPLVYSSPDRPGTIDTLKLTLTRERAQLRAQISRMPAPAVDTPSGPVAGPAELQEDKTYRAPDGRVFRVVRGGSGYLYGKLWISTGPREGYWDYFPGIRQIDGLVLLTLAEVQEFGQLTGQCCECQTSLKDPVSIVLGIGPICEQNFTGKARSRSKAFRAEVLSRATPEQVQQMSPADRPAAPAVETADAPF